MSSDLSASSTSVRALQIAHVLFMDIVAYSQLPMDEQTRLIELLQNIVRNSDEFIRAQKRRQLLRLPTGDGMALVFFGDAEAAARCALEIGKALREHSELKLRMGIHTGPVQRVEDINANRNVAGGGINLAQRVMDCGDAGHILVSKSVAEVLSQMSHWKGMLHDLGEVQVKHGVKVHIYNLYADRIGNAELPQKLLAAEKEATAAKRRKVSLALTAAGLVAAVTVGGLFYFRRPARLTDRDTIVLADFANKTGDEIFNDTLKTALTVALSQSPFLNILSDNRAAAELKLMTRPPDTRLSPDIAREVCQRTGSKAYIAGSITTLGSQYVLGLKAVDCRSGDTLAQEQATAGAKETVLDALGEASSKLRAQLGESLVTVQKLDVPLSEATTSSLDALQAYSLGEQALAKQGAAAALPHHQQAIDLDPNFAMGYEEIGEDYSSMGETGRAREYFAKAFQLRDHASEREKLAITANYYGNVTGEVEKAAQSYQQWIASYPRSSGAHTDLGNVYLQLGQYEKAIEVYRENLTLAPDVVALYGDLAGSLLALQRFDDAQQTIEEAHARKLDDYVLRLTLYALAFLRNQGPAMAEEEQWFVGRPEQNEALALASDTEAYRGFVGKARQLTRRAVNSAIGADSKETGAIWLENSALREAAIGNSTEAREASAEGMKLAPTSPGAAAEAALAFAMAGDAARAKSLVQDLNNRFPLDTQMQSLWLPAIQAQLELDRGTPALALNTLQATVPIEFGGILFLNNISCLYPTYIRGEAYLATGQGKEAAAEFQKIIDHSGIVWNCWTGALAHLGVARANALQAKTSQGADADAARVRTLAAYKDFLTLWKDADPDIPIYKAAKAEYAKLL